MDAHEKMFINKFLTAAYRDRCVAKKGIPRSDLWHLLVSKLDPRRCVELPNNVHVAERIIPVLRELCSASTGVCISADRNIDGASLRLEESVDHEGTTVSYAPGELAFYQSEGALPRTFQAMLIDDPGLKSKAERLFDEAHARYKALDRGR